MLIFTTTRDYNPARMNESFQTESLGKYGKIIREYEGKGLLTLYDGQTCNCLVRAVQLANGKINASCFFSENLNLVLGCWGRGDAIKSIKGITRDNSEFLLGKHIWCTNVSPIWNSAESTMAVLTGSLKYWKKQSDAIASVRFGITNFEYSGNTYREYPNGGGTWDDILSVNLGDKSIEIHKLQDYKAIMESVEAQRGIDVTSEAVVNISSIADLDTVIPLIDALCIFLSLARGTKINWIYYDCYDSRGEKILSSHNNNVVWRYAGLPLIDPRNPNDTISFINQSFSAYLSQRDDLDIAIETYLDAKRETGYLEIRALRAVVVLEFMKSRYAARKGIDFILQDSQFKKIRHAVKSTLTEQFKAMSLSEHALNEVESKIGELNRHSFRTILETMFAELGISITEDELDRFIKIRNSLVHTASFIGNVSEEHIQDYYFLIGTLDRIFLKILNYNGTYLDITNKFNRIDTTQKAQKTE